MRAVTEFLMSASIPLTHFTDASAAHGVIKRRGAGAIKHLSVRQLWLQEVMREPGNASFKINRAENPADILCSVGSTDAFSTHLTAMNFNIPSPFRGGVIWPVRE